MVRVITDLETRERLNKAISLDNIHNGKSIRPFGVREEKTSQVYTL